eukprot:XP_001704295.1 Hypothetical protein GL50803_19466 [Giardia lamblia ATCC 50803]
MLLYTEFIAPGWPPLFPAGPLCLRPHSRACRQNRAHRLSRSSQQTLYFVLVPPFLLGPRSQEHPQGGYQPLAIQYFPLSHMSPLLGVVQHRVAPVLSQVGLRVSPLRDAHRSADYPSLADDPGHLLYWRLFHSERRLLSLPAPL